MCLTEQDVIELTDWRRALHRWPELSWQEAETARTVEGENHSGLHNPDYDYLDALIGVAARVFMRTLRDLLG